MHMRKVVVTNALAIALAGCAGPQVLPTNGDGHSQVSGAIAVPDEFSGSPLEFCDHIELRATALSGTQVGHARVNSDTRYCTYNIEGLPVSTPLNISIQNSSVFRCLRGAGVVFSPEAVPVTLKNGEARAFNFDASCEG